MKEENKVNGVSIESLGKFFNKQHDILVCTANNKGEPNIAIMGTPRLVENGTIEFEIGGPISVTLQNIKENKEIVFMTYIPGDRARNYKGARIQAEVIEMLTTGEKIENIRNMIREQHGEEETPELLATITCSIKKIRPIVDKGQRWDEPPFGNVYTDI